MFYDDDVIIDLGNNYVAESVHFQIQGATASPNSGISGLSPAVAAGAGVGGTLVLVLLGLFIGYFCLYRRRQLKKKRETISSVSYTPGHPYSKHELDSKPGTSDRSISPSDPDHHSLKKSLAATSVQKTYAPSHHEMEVYPGTGTASVSSPSVASPSGELAVARHSRLPQNHAGPPAAPCRELAVSPVRHEMPDDPHRVCPQELPGDIYFGNARSKEWKT